MADRELTTLLEGGGFFEGPRWHDGLWWVSDFYRGVVLTIAPDGSTEQVMAVEQQPSGLGWMPDGSLLVVSMKDHRILRRARSGAVTVHAELASYCGGHVNDMVVDAHGRAYVGEFGFDLQAFADPELASLMRVDPDGSITVLADDLLFPNGAVITPDGATLIVGETAGARYTAFALAPDGTVSDRRIWAQLAPTPELGTLEQTLPQLKFAPDGCTLDADGCIWAADAVGARCARVAQGGAIVDEIPAPDGLGIFACMLGGGDGRTLLMCAAPDFLEANRAHTREAVLLSTVVEVPHAGLP
jgi:sugar lactone lactonase YvrE